nr:DUF4219 domain-containing protein/UBN2 domain-containing protein [Tanacetum cinerariifolium]
MVRLWWLLWPHPARSPPQRWRQTAELSEAPIGVAPPQPDTTWCGCGGCTIPTTAAAAAGKAAAVAVVVVSVVSWTKGGGRVRLCWCCRWWWQRGEVAAGDVGTARDGEWGEGSSRSGDEEHFGVRRKTFSAAAGGRKWWWLAGGGGWLAVVVGRLETVTAASAIITTAEAQVPAATTATLTDAPVRVAAAPSRRRKGVLIRDPEEESTTSTIIPAETKSEDKGKGILVEEPKHLKKKQQIKRDEQYARELHAELNKDIDWDKAMDHVKRKAKEDPPVKKYQAMKRNPQTEAQTRKNMMMYLKNVVGFKLDYFKGMSYDDIRPIFEAKFNSNTPAERAAKRRKLDEEVEDLKRHLQIVPNEDDDVYTEATPLARKIHVVDYEIIEMNSKPYYKIIRADEQCLRRQMYMLKSGRIKEVYMVKQRSRIGSYWNDVVVVIFVQVKMIRDVLTVGSTMWIPLLFWGEYSQWSERFMNYLEEQIDGEAMINSIKNGDQLLPTVTQVSIVGATSSEQPPLKDESMWSDQEKKIQKIDRLARSLLIQGLPDDIYSLIDSNKTAKDLWDALERHMLGFEYGDVNDAMKSKKKAVVITSDPLALVAEQTKVSKRKEKVVVSSESEGSDDASKTGRVIGLGYTSRFLIHSDEALEIEKFKRSRENKIEFAYDYGSLNAKWKQYATMMRQNKNLMDINIDALYNILKQNQGDINDAMGSKNKTLVVTSDPLALIAEKTKVSKSKEKVVVSSDSEGSDADDFSELKKITALLAKAFNRRKFYSKPTNNNLRTSSTSQSANKKQEFVKSDDKQVVKKADEKKRDISRTKMLLAKRDKDEQVLLDEDQAWIESSSDSDQEINANMVFMAQIKKVLLDSEASSSSANEKISEVSYYLLGYESESEFETLEYYDNSTNYGLFVNNDDYQEFFHDAIESASKNFIKNHIDSQKDYDKSDVDHNDFEEKDHLVDKLIRKFNKKIVKCQKRIEKGNQQSKYFENQNKDLQDKYDVLKKQITTFEIKNKELNEQLKELIEMNNDLLAQTKVLKEQLQVKHVMIDTRVESLEIEKFKRSRENKIEFAYDYGNLNASYMNEKIKFEDDYFQEIINPDFEKIDSPFQQTSSLKPYVPNAIFEKIIIDLEDEVMSLLEKEKANLETIESLKSKSFESSEKVSSESEKQSENDRLVVEKECDKEENP